MGELERIYQDAQEALRRGASPVDVDAFVRHETNGKTPSLQALRAVISTPKPGQGWLATFGQGMAANRVPTPAEAGAMARGAAQGATIGFADELAGAATALGPAGMAAGPVDAYRSGRDAYRERDAQARAAAPGSFGVGSLAGSAALPGLGAGKTAASGGWGLLKSALGTGAGYGGAAGLGFSESDTPVGVAGDVAQGVALGAGAGLLTMGLIASAVFVARSGVRLFDRSGALTSEARRRLTKLLTEAGKTPEQVTADLQTLEAAAPGNTVLAQALGPDIGGGALQVAADRAPQLRPRITALGRNLAGQPDRLASRLEQTLGVTASEAREAQQASKAALRPFGERLYKSLEPEYVTSPRVTEALADADAAGAVGGARPKGVPAGQIDPAHSPLISPKSIAEVASANPEGFTIDPRTGSLFPYGTNGNPILNPRTGQPFEGGASVVAVVNGPRGGVATPEEATAVVQQFMDEHGVALRNDPTLVIGGWRNPETGRYHIDLGRLTDAPTATRLGRAGGQNSYANLDAGANLELGGNAATTTDIPPRPFPWLQRVLQKMQDAAGVAFRAGAGNEGAKLKELARRVEAGLSEELPAFATAQRQFGQGKAVTEAFELGARWFDMPFAEVQQQMGRLIQKGGGIEHGGQDVLTAARMGFLLKIATQFRQMPTNRNPAAMLQMLGPDKAATFRFLFPDDAMFERFMQTVWAEGEKAAVQKAATGGPNTARRLSDAESTWESVVRGGAAGGFSGAANAAKMRLLGNLQTQFSRDVQGEVGRMLLANPEEASVVLQGLTPSLVEPGLAGVLGAGTPLLFQHLRAR